MRKSKTIFTVLIAVLIGIALWFIIAKPKSSTLLSDLSYGEIVEISGIPTCVPHKNTEGPQTLECLLGIKDAQGRYFAYILVDRNQEPSQWAGNTVILKGTLLPPEPNTIYQLTGTLKDATVITR